MKSKIIVGAMLVAGLGACTVRPTGPSVMVLPGRGQTIERFRADEAYCRDDAMMQIGGKSAQNAARESAVTSAAVGTAVGALAGAALGGNSQGAAIGAGAGLLMGSAVGGDTARTSGYGTQRQYDNAYVQCMYTKGHRVPVPAGLAAPRAVRSTESSAPPVRASDAAIPPPPPGLPPPPPPGVTQAPR